jgi:hypothetical protein
MCISILNWQYPHRGPYERDYPYFWPPFNPVSLSWAQGQGVKVQALESIKNLFMHINSSKLHFGHIWLTYFGCANEFLGLCRTFFGRSFISKCGAYQWSSSFGKHTSCFGHFVLMCRLSPFLSHLDKLFLFLLISFNKFQQNNYVSMWKHYGSKVLGVYSRPLNEASSPTTDLLWWYRPFIYGKLCPIWCSRELGFGGSIFVL